jgi:hypothetical protein
MGLMPIENELTAVDDRTFRWALKKPFPKLLVALGKVGTPSCFILPARIAATDPFKPIDEYVGSGPMRLVRNEWIPGARAVFEKFADYVPRQEPNSWLAGGKRMLLHPHRMDRDARMNCAPARQGCPRHALHAPLGFFLEHQAWRNNVTGIVKGPLPFFWGVGNKTA